MPATVEYNESNGASETVTHGVANSNMGSVDAVNLDAVANPILPGANSFEKWQKLAVTAMGGSSKIDNIKAWRSGTLGANATHKTNARTTSYAGAAAYATPTNGVSSVATQTVPSTSPASANLGIGGSLTGSITAPGSTDYLVHQIQTTASAVAGSSSTMNISYDETA